MNSQQQHVADFMRMAGQEVSKTPVNIKLITARNRVVYLLEECEAEYLESVQDDDIVGIADALGDSLYVLLGTANAHGIDLEPIFEEIHRSNMTKLWTWDECKNMKHNEIVTRINSEERCYRVVNKLGKLIKSPSYSPANLAPIIEAQKKNSQ